MTANLNTQWIVGFTDGEGCFNIDVHCKSDMKWGLQIQPEFTIVQHERDVNLLYALKEHFGCGKVGVNKRDDTSTRYHFRVKAIEPLVNCIIPFFEKHSLKTKKNVEFLFFRDICLKMHKGYHNDSLNNFLEIVEAGEKLRYRIKPKKSNEKRNKVNAQIALLKEKLSQQQNN